MRKGTSRNPLNHTEEVGGYRARWPSRPPALFYIPPSVKRLSQEAFVFVGFVRM
jgi:hypothetical protein